MIDTHDPGTRIDDDAWTDIAFSNNSIFTSQNPSVGLDDRSLVESSFSSASFFLFVVDMFSHANSRFFSRELGLGGFADFGLGLSDFRLRLFELGKLVFIFLFGNYVLVD